MSDLEIRDLSSLDDLRQVIAIEQRVWGYDGAPESVPLPMLAAGVRRGAIVLGAFDGTSMVAACYSFPAMKAGSITQWSHMLAVEERYRGQNVGRQLKLAQRERALAMGIRVIEWTFDPLQAANAHLNLVRLGAIVDEYEVNAYGESCSPLWRGTESDRFVAVWNICDPHVERRLARHGHVVRAVDTLGAVRVLQARGIGDRVEPERPDLHQDGRRLTVEIPLDIAPIQLREPALAMRWRRATREVFTTYLPRGYRVLDFWIDRSRGCGSYLMARVGAVERKDAA